MHKPGDVILTTIQFTDTLETKTRPGLVLFEEFGNIVVAGITSNPAMQGIPLTKEEGSVKDSVIKLNYIFTVSSMLVKKKLFELTRQKKQLVHKQLSRRLGGLVQ